MKTSCGPLVALALIYQSACSSTDDVKQPAPQKFNADYVELERESFKTQIDGKNTDLFTIKNSSGMFVKITNLGAKIEQLVVPDKDSVFGDVVLGYDSIDGVKSGQGSMGAFIGRYANRIADGKFEIDGAQYSVTPNEAAPKNNLLHGGAKGGRFRVYEAEQISDASVAMSLTYADAEDADSVTGVTGFPGSLAVKVVYTVTDANELRVVYSAKALDKKTIVNFTSHSFFNLSNTAASTSLAHVITVNADKVLEISDRLLPTGVVRDVAGTPMDFRSPKPMGQDYQASYDLLNLVGGGGVGIAGGYDHTFVLNKSAAGELSFAASAYEPNSGRKLEVWSTEPSMQLFSGQNLTGMEPRDIGKGQMTFQKYYGLAMEPMHYPDSPNQPMFPTTELAAGATYEGTILYKFSVQR